MSLKIIGFSKRDERRIRKMLRNTKVEDNNKGFGLHLKEIKKDKNAKKGN